MDWILYYSTLYKCFKRIQNDFFPKFHKIYMFLLPSHWSLTLVSKNSRKCFCYVTPHICSNKSNYTAHVNLYILLYYHKWISHKHQYTICIIHSRELFRKNSLHILFVLILSHSTFENHMIWCSTSDTRPTNTDLPVVPKQQSTSPMRRNEF